MTNNTLDPPSPPQGTPQEPVVPGGVPGEIPIPSNIPRQKNDAVCINCLGVSFYDDALKKAGKKPVCYGIEYKAAVPVPANEMSVLETLPILQPQTKVYAIGLSQYSLRMNRLGQPPVVTKGLKIIMTESDRAIQPPNSPVIPPVLNQLHKREEGVMAKKKDQLFAELNDAISLKKSMNRYWALYKRSCSNIFRGANSMWSNREALASRLYKGMTKFLDNYQRFLVKSGKSAYKRVFEDREKRDQGGK